MNVIETPEQVLENGSKTYIITPELTIKYTELQKRKQKGFQYIRPKYQYGQRLIVNIDGTYSVDNGGSWEFVR